MNCTVTVYSCDSNAPIGSSSTISTSLTPSYSGRVTIVPGTVFSATTEPSTISMPVPKRNRSSRS